MKGNDVLVLIAVWALLNAAAALVAIAIMAVFAYPPALDLSGVAQMGALFALVLATLLSLEYFALSMVAGTGVLARKERGRIAAIILAALSLPRVPFGSTVGFLTLIYLTRPRVKERFRTASQQ